MNYWLHRISGGVNAIPLSYSLFEQGYISIGWSDLSDQEDLLSLTKSRVSFEDVFDKYAPGHPKNRYNLWRFLNEFKTKDIVIVPFPYKFAICEIIDDTIYTNETIDKSLLVDYNQKKIVLKDDGYLYDEKDNWIDLGFYRKVRVIANNLSRWEYADQHLYSKLKILQTNANLNDIKDSVNRAINNKPINLKSSIIESTWKSVLEQISELQSAEKFEVLIQNYLQFIGGRVYVPSKNESSSEEGDADVIAFFDQLKVAIMVQAKKHNSTTDSWAITQITAYKKNHHYDEGWTTVLWVISTCDKFSEEAIKMANESEYDIRLINGQDFARMILESGLGWIRQ